MKKIFIAISFLAITAAAFAGNCNTKNISPEKKLDASIQNQLAYPEFLLERPGEHTAEVHFTINPNGTINVKEIQSDETDLRENLIYQLKTFTVYTTGLDLSDTYLVVVRFETM